MRKRICLPFNQGGITMAPTSPNHNFHCKQVALPFVTIALQLRGWWGLMVLKGAVHVRLSLQNKQMTRLHKQWLCHSNHPAADETTHQNEIRWQKQQRQQGYSIFLTWAGGRLLPNLVVSGQASPSIDKYPPHELISVHHWMAIPYYRWLSNIASHYDYALLCVLCLNEIEHLTKDANWSRSMIVHCGWISHLW